MTYREALLQMTAALRNMALALEADVRTDHEAMILGMHLAQPFQRLAHEIEAAIDCVEADRERRRTQH